MKSYVCSLAFALVATMIVSYSLAADAAAALDAGAPPGAPLSLSGSADAAATTPAVLPDPAESPAEAVSMLTSLWKSGAIPSVLILALYFAAVLAGRWVGWLRGSKRRAAITGAALALLTTLAEAASRGTTPTLAMFLAGAATAVALFTKLDGDGDSRPASAAT